MRLRGIGVELSFESTGEELKAKCIRRRFGKWKECTLDIERDVHINDATISVRVTPVAYQNSISFKNPTADFRFKVRVANKTCQALGKICDAIEKAIQGKVRKGVEEAVARKLGESTTGKAVADAVRKSMLVQSFLKPSWKVRKISSNGGGYVVTIERPDTLDQSSVTRIDLVPIRASTTASCPVKVDFDATIKMRHTVSGSGFLIYESGERSPKFSWNAHKGQTVSSRISRTVAGQAGAKLQGWVVMRVVWQGTNGKTYTRDSNQAVFSVTCTPSAPGGISH